jgi:hypothetical protein
MKTPPGQPSSATPTRPRRLALLALFLPYAAGLLPAQPVVAPWGNLLGIQVDGEPMPFEASLRAVDPGWTGFVQSSKYNWEGKPLFTQEGNGLLCSHALEGTGLDYRIRVEDRGHGAAHVELKAGLRTPLAMAGAYYCVELPAELYKGGQLELLGAEGSPVLELGDRRGQVLRVRARGFRAKGHDRSLELLADTETELILRQDFVDRPAHLNDPLPRLRFVDADPERTVPDYQIYLAILPVGAAPGTSATTAYAFRAEGTIDHAPAQLTLRADEPGRRFDGIGGNFRMQFPELDAQVVEYCLANLDLAWGRICFPWAEWQPEESSDRSAAFLSGDMGPYFRAQMEMARTLARRHIPIIASVWVPPEWAVDKSLRILKGVKLDRAKLQRSADSIAAGLLFMKRHYGVEVELFSFNETDYGVEVHQSPEEHALVNRVFGATFAARGLRTRMLLGDTGAGTAAANGLVRVSQEDRTQASVLGGIAFHTYHGLTPRDLQAWWSSAQATNLPLLVDEGGADSAAHRYPLIWSQPWFAQLEIDQYLRIAAACQPASFLPWQLNADYSLLAGGGIYGDHGPLRPTQRFWCLRQLGLLSGGFWLPVQVDQPKIQAAALGDIASGRYAIHLANNGAERELRITGLPASVRRLRILCTDARRGMEEMGARSVVDGVVSIRLGAQSFTTLLSD